MVVLEFEGAPDFSGPSRPGGWYGSYNEISPKRPDRIGC